MSSLIEIGLSNALVAAALALIAGLAGLILRRRPAVVHALWLLVLLKLVTPPLVRVPLPWPAETAKPAVAETSTEQEQAPDAVVVEEANEEAKGVVDEEAAPLADPREEIAEEPIVPEAKIDSPPEDDSAILAMPQSAWLVAVSALWVAGSAGWFLLAGWRLRCFARLLDHARPAPEKWRKLVAELAREVGLARPPETWLVPGKLAPMVWAALGRPRLILPQTLLDRMDAKALETLLIHELAHIQRRDHWVRRLEFVALGLFWWHPVAWYARHELHEAEELCCDARVVTTRPLAGRTYATALVDVLDFLSDAPAAATPALASGVGRVADLKRRLTMILRGTTPHGLGRPATLLMLALAALVLPLVPGLASAQTDPAKRAEATRARAVELELVLQGAKKQGDLAKLEAEIAKMAVELAKKKLALDAARKAKAAAGATNVKKSGVSVRIELNGLTAAEAKEVAKHLEKALPGKDKNIIVIVGQQRATGARLWTNRDTGAVPRIQVVPRAGVPALPAATPKTPQPPQGGFRFMMPGKGGDGIEKKLDGIMKQLESLKKELEKMKGPRSRSLRPGGPATGGGGSGTAPPAAR